MANRDPLRGKLAGLGFHPARDERDWRLYHDALGIEPGDGFRSFYLLGRERNDPRLAALLVDEGTLIAKVLAVTEHPVPRHWDSQMLNELARNHYPGVITGSRTSLSEGINGYASLALEVRFNFRRGKPISTYAAKALEQLSPYGIVRADVGQLR